MKSIADRMLAALAIALAFVSLSGCATSKSLSGYAAKSAVLHGMIYNEDRRPVQDVEVTLLDGAESPQSARSDIHGRFALPGVPFGQTKLRFAKASYEVLAWDFVFEGPTQVVYAKMTNMNELLDGAVGAMQKRDWAKASSSLERARKIDGTSVVVAYLEAEMLGLRGFHQQAAAELEKLSSERAPSFAIELSLADLYQYKLSLPAKALSHLKKALAIKADIDLQTRVAELEQKPEVK
jgi:hypothetical protein